jgi:hypothetical protein
MSFGPQSYPADYQAIFDPEVNAAEASHGTTTPTRRNQASPSLDISFAIVPVKEDNTPQNYGGRYSRSQSMEGDSQLSHSRNNVDLASTSKRPSEFTSTLFFYSKYIYFRSSSSQLLPIRRNDVASTYHVSILNPEQAKNGHTNLVYLTNLMSACSCRRHPSL